MASFIFKKEEGVRGLGLALWMWIEGWLFWGIDCGG